MNRTIKELLAGYVVGAANIIPGVSGGTFLLILGLYERLITILSSIHPMQLLFDFGNCIVPFRKQSRPLAHPREDLLFLVRLVGGAALALFTLSHVITILLESHHTITYAFFFGLILISSYIPIRLLRTPSISLFLPLLMGGFLSLGLSSFDQPVETTLSRSAQYEARYYAEDETSADESPLKQTAYSPRTYGAVFISGALAMAAMILPGLSGSLILLMLGQYLVVISAISALLRSPAPEHILLLTIMAMGMLFGLIFFVKVIHTTLQRFHDGTMSFLTGLILGSLYTLWPFKERQILPEVFLREDGEIVRVEGYELITAINQAPSGDTLLPALTAFLFGAGTMIICIYLKERSQ
ncbi:DUF368 domain-containing protein [Chitinivibrio alkaliphilus]|uniref:Putative membrane protein n=1 Tax=Chitinivibrio alkaliphilus ACht1 TaxID=1313304 RepID=U7D9R2_9BACT|nr:DUF368 domain-containing protein [Chitinivibrio alkaliphilus]ERP39134.1 putative membrane protein [Chitinivibrio alkaliphilus ACht1]